MPCSANKVLLANPKEDPNICNKINPMDRIMASLRLDKLCSSNLDSLKVEILPLLLAVLVNIPLAKCLQEIDHQVKCLLVSDLLALLPSVCLLVRDLLVHLHLQPQDPALEIYLVTH
jgi:ABC-type tungstate transport system substrate-binding protein